MTDKQSSVACMLILKKYKKISIYSENNIYYNKNASIFLAFRMVKINAIIALKM